MTTRPHDPIAEFNRLAATYEAAGRLAAASDYECVRDANGAFGELRDALENRLLTLAWEIRETIGA